MDDKCPIFNIHPAYAYIKKKCRCTFCIIDHKRRLSEWYKKNAIRISQKRKEYKLKNRDKINEGRRKNYQRNKSSIKNSHLKRLYGLTIEQYCNMEIQQNYKCAICQGINKETRLAIDHNHITKKVRALLCTRCNLIIGSCKENIEILSKIIEYLKFHS